MSRNLPDYETFSKLASLTPEQGGGNFIPIFRRLFSDALTPVLAYRRLVQPDPRMAPSFLFESVLDGAHVGRYSFLGSRPIAELIAFGNQVQYIHHADQAQSRTFESADPLQDMAGQLEGLKLAKVDGLPAFTGGWVGYTAYDAVRYLEPDKLHDAPKNDRNLPDVHMQLYHDVIAFDHVQKTVLVMTHVQVDKGDLKAAYRQGEKQLEMLTQRLLDSSYDSALCPASGHVDLAAPPPTLPQSNMGEGGYQDAVSKCKEYIAAGDAFQIVPSQRFELLTEADPFDIYRALRVVNPSPYMFYLQVRGGILVGSSPETLCQVIDGKVMTRPLAGTRKRGVSLEEDAALAAELLEDPKDRAEHIMLVDLGRNDVGRVACAGTIELPRIFEIERYSHVMHISSTVTGQLREGLSAWDALRAILPVGTVSGAPKVRAMQIIDELEPTRRGPYAGAVGYVDFAGNMDMAIALRTMVVTPVEPTASDPEQWKVHVQAGAGIVADSDPDLEHQETVNKAAALAKAVDLAKVFV